MTRLLTLASALFLLVVPSALPESIASPNLGVGISSTEPTVDPALPYQLVAQYGNSGPVPATNVVITIDLPEEVTLQQKPDFCTAAGQRLTCSVGTVTANFNPTQAITVTVVAPDRREGITLTNHASITATEPDSNLSNNEQTSLTRLYRTFLVENTADAGSGSLRAAIDAANAACTDSTRCKIAFRLGDAPAGGYHTIAPLTPLPAVAGRTVAVDGTTQTRRSGDSNPAGPELYLDGSQQRDGSGVVLASQCESSVRGFAIGNFPENGVGAERSDCRSAAGPDSGLGNFRDVYQNYIGIDPTGLHAAPNGRGIFITATASQEVTIRENVISANRRSGIWLQETGLAYVSKNVIGLDPAHRVALGNGASGIYAARGVHDATIVGNYIAFNHDFGVAIDRSVTGVDIQPNSIFANWQLGIDRGLDGADAPATKPILTAVQYDPTTDTTVIDGTFEFAPSFIGPDIDFYAADAPHRSGFGDGQYYLGTIRLMNKAFRFAAKGDWRGKWVSATGTINIFFGFLTTDPDSRFFDTHSATSEFSVAISVK